MQVSALRVPPAPVRTPKAVSSPEPERTALSSAPDFSLSLSDHLTSFGSAIKREVSGEARAERQARSLVAAVQAQDLTKADLKALTAGFKARLAAGESLEELQVEAYAAAREAARRVTGMTAFDEQVLGAVYAHQGSIVDMKTGEGKTLMGVLPTYLHALTGKGVHVVTANQYLAQRDRDQLAPIFAELGLTAGVIVPDQEKEARRAANQADITYGTASEFGFQYLTDNLAITSEERVGRDLSGVFALVDEADSLLLDEARTPLIIADRIPQDNRVAKVMAEVVRHLKPGQDIGTEPARKLAWLTEAGSEKAGKLLGIANLYEPQNESLVSALHSAVTARALYQRNTHYVVQQGEVVLVDEFTGRLKPGHRFAEGLHQAIEAAEGLEIGPEQKTMAGITYPNYFRLYSKVSGMTGTGASAAQEFREVFGLPVRLVPTHKPRIRVDHQDQLYATSAQRDAALAAEVKRLHQTGQPVLIGSRSIERSQELSQILTELGIPHQVLNALNAEREAGIIAEAGKKGAVTIATNMAGRGVDIKLGPGVRELGGLAVLLSERHEARRIDEQFIGRSGRQGDPGRSQCFLSLQDDLFRLHGEKLPEVGSSPLTGLKVQAAVAAAQARAEGRDLESRQHLLKYDGVVNLQRQAVYAERDAVIAGAEVDLEKMVERVSQDAEQRHFGTGLAVNQPQLQKELSYLLGGKPVAAPSFENGPALKGWLRGQLQTALAAQQAALPPGVLGNVVRSAYLEALDQEWATQQTSLEQLRDGAWMQAYGEKEPLREYERGAHELYGGMLDRVAARVMHSSLSLRAAS
ncbi:MAG: protein translocase subunit SecA 1 [Candidatus Xenobia bacterium]